MSKSVVCRLMTLESQYALIVQILKDQKEKNEYFERIIEEQNSIIKLYKNRYPTELKKCPDCGISVKFGRCTPCWKKSQPKSEKINECNECLI